MGIINSELIVLSEAYQHLRSASAEELNQADQAARQAGCLIYPIPADFTFMSVEQALIEVPFQPTMQVGAWIGFIPGLKHYTAIYEAALLKNIRLLNSPEQYQRAQEFDLAYPYLQGLTPESFVVDSLDQCDQAFCALGAPVFVKGAIQSRKRKGWKACVAYQAQELEDIVKDLFELPEFTGGRILIRRLVPLKITGKFGDDFPKGREYRCFVYQGQIIGLAYYWEGQDPFGPLTESERSQVIELAQKSAQKLAVPYFCVDVGQCEDDSWTIIETGDAQFTSVSQLPINELWQNLKKVIC